ncbi:MAG: WYL domain-containing protein [Rhodocyclaceae bacterium]
MTTKIEKPKTSWGQERRLQFIDFRLRWEGRLNRKDLIEHFGVSVPQSSLDIAKYLELAPSNLVYDRSSKSYQATDDFNPVYPQSSANRYLAELLATKSGLLELRGTSIGAGIEIDFAPTPSRTIDDKTVASIVRAIKAKRSILVRYQSMSSSELERVLSPVALGHDGFRWHVRAYSHRKNEFGDFVLTRFSNVRDHGAATAHIEDDTEWNTEVPLILVPHPDLPDEKRAAIAYDYGMVNGEVTFLCRQALLFYTLKNLGLAVDDGPIVTHICLKNQTDVQPYLDTIRNRSLRK